MSMSSQSISVSSGGSSFPDQISILNVPSQQTITNQEDNESTTENTNKTSNDNNLNESPSSPVKQQQPQINPMDAFFNSFYTALSNFSFDKAKEIVDKQQREFTIRHHHGGPSNSTTVLNANNWLLLMTSMCHLASAEKNYMNLTFLHPKGFLRKDSNLKSSMMLMKADLKKLVEPVDEQILLRDEILVLVGIRLELTDFYEKLSILGTAKNVEIIDLLSDVELIVEKYNDEKEKSRKSAQSIFKSIGWEIEIVTSLLKAHSNIQNWEFLPSLISLQDANKQLTEWANYLQLKESAKKSTFYNFSPAMPILYQWIWKLKATLLSKFSAYFYEILAKNSNETYNIRFYCTKLQTDLYYRLTSFQKKTDAIAVCLVLDARESKFYPSGYQHPARPVKPPEGIDSFPAILAIPSKPTTHWPSVVMIISDRLQALNSDKFIGFYDNRVNTTYFIQRVDTKMYLLTLFDTKKSEKDAYIAKFMQELAVELKCGKIFSSLKCGSK